MKFWPEGLLDPLRAIADGRGEPRHGRQIRALLRKTDREVEKAGRRLIKVRDRYVSFEIGPRVADVLGNIIYKKRGQDGIRFDLRQLAARKDLRSSGACLVANQVLRDIETFNERHQTLIDEIRRHDVPSVLTKKPTLGSP